MTDGLVQLQKKRKREKMCIQAVAGQRGGGWPFVPLCVRSVTDGKTSCCCCFVGVFLLVCLFGFTSSVDVLLMMCACGPGSHFSGSRRHHARIRNLKGTSDLHKPLREISRRKRNLKLLQVGLDTIQRNDSLSVRYHDSWSFLKVTRFSC